MLTTNSELQKRKIDQVDTVLKKMQNMVTESMSFGKRLGVLESKFESFKDQTEKRHDSMKDYVGKTKDLLEARCD